MYQSIIPHVCAYVVHKHRQMTLHHSVTYVSHMMAPKFLEQSQHPLKLAAEDKT